MVDPGLQGRYVLPAHLIDDDPVLHFLLRLFLAVAIPNFLLYCGVGVLYATRTFPFHLLRSHSHSPDMASGIVDIALAFGVLLYVGFSLALALLFTFAAAVRPWGRWWSALLGGFVAGVVGASIIPGVIHVLTRLT